MARSENTTRTYTHRLLRNRNLKLGTIARRFVRDLRRPLCVYYYYYYIHSATFYYSCTPWPIVLILIVQTIMARRKNKMHNVKNVRSGQTYIQKK